MRLFRLFLLHSFLLITNKEVYSQDIIVLDTIQYKWYRPELNYIQYFNKKSFEGFSKSLKSYKNQTVSILHFGDSHIQSEIPSSTTRDLLQEKYGDAGKGMIFPYSTAKTYSSIRYSSKHKGNWTFSKTNKSPIELPLGISGMSSRTIDSNASFSITFNSKLPESYSEIRLFCKIDSLSYDLTIESNGNTYPVSISKSSKNKSYISIPVTNLGNLITFSCSKSDTLQNQFTLFGFDISDKEKSGLVYHSLGVGGAKFKSILLMDQFENQIKDINPSLIILDFGTNDILYSDTLKPSLENEIKEIIRKINRINPNTSILLCSTQDIYYKNKNITSTESYSKLLGKIAKEMNVCFWDWFWLSGGKAQLKTWESQGLAKSDYIHLTNNGYKVKGQLLFDAIENTLNYYSKTENQAKLSLDYSKFHLKRADFIPDLLTKTEQSSEKEVSKSISEQKINEDLLKPNQDKLIIQKITPKKDSSSAFAPSKKTLTTKKIEQIKISQVAKIETIHSELILNELLIGKSISHSSEQRKDLLIDSGDNFKIKKPNNQETQKQTDKTTKTIFKLDSTALLSNVNDSLKLSPTKIDQESLPSVLNSISLNHSDSLSRNDAIKLTALSSKVNDSLKLSLTKIHQESLPSVLNSISLNHSDSLSHNDSIKLTALSSKANDSLKLSPTKIHQESLPPVLNSINLNHTDSLLSNDSIKLKNGKLTSNIDSISNINSINITPAKIQVLNQHQLIKLISIEMNKNEVFKQDATPIKPPDATHNKPVIKKNKRANFYKVRNGDSLYEIALKFNVTIEQIKKTNKLKESILPVGKLLIIP